MKYTLMAIAIAAAGICLSGCKSDQMSVVPNGFVPDNVTAVKLAKIYLEPIYGTKLVQEQEPYSVLIKDDYWIVNGSKRLRQDMGPLQILITRSNGQVVAVYPVVDFNKKPNERVTAVQMD